MTNIPTCRWAALSLSNIAAEFFPDLLKRTESSFDHQLVAVSTTRSQSQARKWLSDHKIPSDNIQVYQSWESMLEDKDLSFDVLYISTPHPLHYQHVQKALTCKRNVLVEKPATMNAAQWRKCMALAKENGMVLMEAMWTRYLPMTRRLQNDIIPRLGDIKRIYAEFSFPIVSPDMPSNSRFLDKKAGAGSLLDQGVYALTWVDLAVTTDQKGEGESLRVVHANTLPISSAVPASSQVDDITTLVLRSSSTVAIVTTSMTLVGSNKPGFYTRFQATKHAPGVRIEGTRGCVAIPFPLIRAEEVQVQWYGEEDVDSQGREKDEGVKEEVVGWGLWYQADVIAKTVHERHTDGSGGDSDGVVIGDEETLRVLEWMDQAREQAGIQYDEELDRV